MTIKNLRNVQTLQTLRYNTGFARQTRNFRSVKQRAIVDEEDCYTVFHFCKTNKIQDVHDIEQHLEITNHMREWQNRSDYFLINGLDYDKVEKYYDVVKKLNNAYYSGSKKTFLQHFKYLHFKLLYWITFTVVSFLSNFQ